MQAISTISFLLFLSLCKTVVSTSEPPCRDDPFFQFGSYTVNGKQIKRTCAWLSEDRDKYETRTKNWCDKRIKPFPVVHVKCPESCGKCVSPGRPNCVMDTPVGWHDRTGEEYDCEWYAGGQNCQLWGNSYPYLGKTANQACCVCGGGCSDFPLGWTDSNGRDCAWYGASASRCKNFGNRFRKHGYVANDACCVCNGGSRKGSTQDAALKEE
mmetsp:Transcript_11029/g.13949  ORF Transcript_11029/g.13949 Transcript_11029/m.13949 type:complete len:212 (-) Transcript_11029:131-766(-)